MVFTKYSAHLFLVLIQVVYPLESERNAENPFHRFIHGYRRGRRMRFLLNDTLACLSYLRHGKPAAFFGGIVDIFRAREALFRFTDQKPFWRYLYLTLRGRGNGQ